LKSIFIGLAFGIVAYAALYISSNQNRYESLSIEGRRVTGTVVAKQPENHRAIVYQFNAGDIDFTGIGGANGGISFDEVEVGSSVPVVYDPDYPLNSLLGDPAIVAESNSRFFVPASVFLGFVMTVISAAIIYFVTKVNGGKVG